MDQREQVRRAYFIEGKSIRRIAREGLHDRRTVRKFLRDAGPPRYTLKVPRRRPVLEPFLSVIHQWLKEDEDRPSKQTLLTASTTAWSQSLALAAENLPSGSTSGRSGLGEK